MGLIKQRGIVRQFNRKEDIIDFEDFLRGDNDDFFNAIEQSCPDLITPDEEEFEYQAIYVHHHDNTIDFVMPNTLDNYSIRELKFAFTVRGSIEDHIKKGIYFNGDLSLYRHVPNRIPPTICDQVVNLVTITLNYYYLQTI